MEVNTKYNIQCKSAGIYHTGEINKYIGKDGNGSKQDPGPAVVSHLKELGHGNYPLS